MARFNVYHKPFYLGIQNGRWLPVFTVIPTNAQYLYSINIGLLYGAKGFVPMNCFTRENGAVTGFYDPATQTYSALDTFTKEVVKPRLSGFFGRTLKNITQSFQYPDINLNTSYKFITSIDSDIPSYDLGFFTGETDVKYFMLLRRWYQTSNPGTVIISYNLNSTNYKNFKLCNYIDSTYSYKNCIDTIHFNAGPGDGRLFSLAPVVKYGGEIRCNETISGTNTLAGEMSIKSNAVLTVNGI